MIDNKDYKEILCASLFHDIGKLVYRAKYEKGRHELLSEYFYNQYISHVVAFKALDNVPYLISSHHDNKDNRNAIISEADQLSAGEREPSPDTFTLSPLKSIFSTVTIDNRPLPKGYYYYDPDVLSISALFPKVVKSENDLLAYEDDFANKYKKVYDSLCTEFSLVKDIRDFNCAINTSLTILEKHLSLIPSAAYKSIPDVSLYDHSKMTAAIASCLFLSDDYDNPFLFIEGDISGIQNYIYNIKNAEGVELKMAKRLRGRSFEIVLVTDAIVTYILNKLCLTRVHVIFCGGGNFILMIPANNSFIKTINGIEEEINRFLFTRYQGNLGLVLVSKIFRREEINDFNSIGIILKEKITVRKQQKYKNLFSDSFFGPYEFSDDTTDICALCGRDFKKGNENICKFCEEQVHIGEVLTSRAKSNDIMARLITDANEDYERAHLSFKEIGIHYYFVRNNDLDINNYSKIKEINLLTLNNTQLSQTEKIIIKNKNTVNISYGLFFAGTHVPLKNDKEIMTFEELSERREDAYPLIGVLRSDVDDLGYIFAYGLENKSISRFATLSRNLNMFYQWIINTLAHDHSIYVTYSGGDDLFVVGNWKDIIEFSIDMRNKFMEYVCNNESFGISAGIGVFSSDYPIRFAAEVSGELENKSKTFLYYNDVQHRYKNAITVFDTTVPWIKFEELKNFAYQLYDLLEENKASTITNPQAKIKASLIYKIYSLTKKVLLKYQRDYQSYLKGQWVSSVRYIIKYILSRRSINHALLTSESEDHEISKKVNIVKNLIKDSTLLNISIPASIVIYSVRKQKGG